MAIHKLLSKAKTWSYKQGVILLLATGGALSIHSQPVSFTVNNSTPAPGEEVVLTANWAVPLGNPWAITFQFQEDDGAWKSLSWTCSRLPCQYHARINRVANIRFRAVVYDPNRYRNGPPAVPAEPPNWNEGWRVAQQKQHVMWTNPTRKTTPPPATKEKSLTLTVNGKECVVKPVPNSSNGAFNRAMAADIPTQRMRANTGIVPVGHLNISYKTTGYSEETQFGWKVELYVGSHKLPEANPQFWPIEGFATTYDTIDWPMVPTRFDVTAAVVPSFYPGAFNPGPTCYVSIGQLPPTK